MFELIYLMTLAQLWLIWNSYVSSNFNAKLWVLAARSIIICPSSPPHSQHLMRLAQRLWFQTWQASPMAFCLWGNLTRSHHRQESCVSLSHSLPLLLFLCITKWLTFMTDTTVAKRAEIFILILMKTGIFERKNAIIVAAFNETVAKGWGHRCISSVFWFNIALVILLFLLLALMKNVAVVVVLEK